MRRIWNDIQNNRDIYAAILGSIASVAVFIVSLIGLLNITILLSLILITLNALTLSIRRDRQIDRATTQSLLDISNSVNAFTAKQGAMQQSLLDLSGSIKDQATHQTTTQQSLLKLSDEVKGLTLNKAFNEQRLAYRTLVDIINHYGVEEASFIQYSGQKCSEVLHTVLSRGGKATVFIQHEDTAAKLGSQLQANRIIESVRSSLSDLDRKFSKSARLKVYKYTTPASISAIKIDDLVLCMGWYTYEKVDRADRSHYRDDQVSVSGHDRAALVAWKGTYEFEMLKQTFLLMEENYRSNAEEVQF